MPKEYTYKKVKVNKPDNISGAYLKKIIDTLGGDYCFSIQDLINFLSTNKTV